LALVQTGQPEPLWQDVHASKNTEHKIAATVFLLDFILKIFNIIKRKCSDFIGHAPTDTDLLMG
jgi:hypothetical protein